MSRKQKPIYFVTDKNLSISLCGGLSMPSDSATCELQKPQKIASHVTHETINWISWRERKLVLERVLEGSTFNEVKGRSDSLHFHKLRRCTSRSLSALFDDNKRAILNFFSRRLEDELKMSYELLDCEDKQCRWTDVGHLTFNGNLFSSPFENKNNGCWKRSNENEVPKIISRLFRSLCSSSSSSLSCSIENGLIVDTHTRAFLPSARPRFVRRISV